MEPERKLATLCLIESILTNVGGIYSILFDRAITAIFAGEYEKVSRACANSLNFNYLIFFTFFYHILRERRVKEANAKTAIHVG